MAAKSGVKGKVGLSGASDFAHVTNIVLNMQSNNPVFSSSSTAGHKVSVAASKQAGPSFDVVLDTADAIYDRVKPGDAVSLDVYEDGVRKFTVPCRIATISETVTVNQDGEITCAVTTDPNGAWTYPSGAVSASA